MSRTAKFTVELTVADDAKDLAVADWLFETLMECPELDEYEPLHSLDSVWPVRA